MPKEKVNRRQFFQCVSAGMAGVSLDLCTASINDLRSDTVETNSSLLKPFRPFIFASFVPIFIGISLDESGEINPDGPQLSDLQTSLLSFGYAFLGYKTSKNIRRLFQE